MKFKICGQSDLLIKEYTEGERINDINNVSFFFFFLFICPLLSSITFDDK